VNVLKRRLWVAFIVSVFVLSLIPVGVMADEIDDALYDIRYCESGGQPNNYTLNTGNGFFGPYQFTLATWVGVGGVGYPHEAEPEEQDYRARVLLTQYGRTHWPHC
jgi:hypothetical protein